MVSSTDFSELSREEQKLSAAVFLPSECDCKIRDTWFYDHNEDTLKSVNELFGMYEGSVYRGSNFLLNIGPDNRGLLPDADVKRVLELGKRIRDAFGNPLSYTDVTKNESTYYIRHNEADSNEWKIPKEERVSNCLVLSEDISKGQRINSFSIYGYLPHYKHKKVLLFEGKTVGRKLICRFNAIRASAFEVVINDFCGEHRLTDIKAYYI